MWEKTLRYPGHVQKIELLKALGFFSEEAVEVEGAKVVPRIASARILEKSLRKPEVGDILAMSVEVEGEVRGHAAAFRYHLLDRFDEESGVTAMARTTAYTASIVAQKLAGGIIKDKGVIPPERLGMDEGLFENIISDLKTRGVTVTES
jgi:saccharopine dehydrogenase-like NADP-dependent oxidoreductase